jgi:hypothetical protein
MFLGQGRHLPFPSDFELTGAATAPSDYWRKRQGETWADLRLAVPTSGVSGVTLRSRLLQLSSRCCCSCGVGVGEASIGFERPAARSLDAPGAGGWVLIDLWISYWNHGGRCHPFIFDAIISDVLIVGGFDVAALASALDELSLETAGERSKYPAVPINRKQNGSCCRSERGSMCFRAAEPGSFIEVRVQTCLG